MYSQGSQFGQGANTPVPPYRRQQLPCPPPLPPHFQQGPPAPPPSVIQPGPLMYQHSLPAAPPLVRQVPPGAMSNTRQSYLHPHSTVHGSTPSQSGASNMHHMSPSVLPPPPPPPPTMYRAPVHLPSQQPGGAQDLQGVPLPPLPAATSSFFNSSPFGRFVQSTGGDSHIPSIAPFARPPPPSSPPPIPPSPPPPTSPLLSSMHYQVDSNLASSNEPFSSKLSTSGSVDKDVATNEGKLIRDLTTIGYLNQEGSLVRDSLLSSDRGILDLPPPPPMPKEGKVVQKIEELCELIAKNGLGYEDMIRQNESGNPEFEFLFAGDPGSEATIAHEYFLWMRQKYICTFKLNEEKINSALRPLVPLSRQPDSLVIAAVSTSPADSDMEMEDDITQSANDKEGNHSTEGTNSEHDLIQNELDIKEQLHAQQISTSEKVSFSSSTVPSEKGEKVVSDHGQSAFERPLSKVCSPVINSADMWPLPGNLKKTAMLLADNKVSPVASGDAEGIHTEKNTSQVIKGGSPFRLLQEYASDDECVSPLKDSPSVAVGASSLHGNTGLNLELDTGSKSQCRTEKGFGLHSGLSISHKAANFPEDSGREIKEPAMADTASGTTGEHVDDKHENLVSISHAETSQILQKKDACGGACVKVSLNGKIQKEYTEKSEKFSSNSLQVDKFGRLVKEGASDSDSDDLRCNGRQNKRGKSQSRSPLDRRRRRSPRRRRDKRSRSRSWSPRNRRSRSRSPRNRRSRSRSPRRRRSRSKSPAFRHVAGFSGDSMRRDRGQIPECFDFRRGRCYRGASCRYLHHDSDKGDGPKRHRSKQQYLEVPILPENSNIHERKHILSKASDKADDEIKVTEIQHRQVMPCSSSVAAKDGNIYWKNEDSISDALQSGTFDRDGQLIDSYTIKSESSIEVAAKVSETQVLEGETEVHTTLANKSWQEAIESQHPLLVDGFSHHASKIVLPLDKSVVKQYQPNLSDPILQNADCLTQQTNNSSLLYSAPGQTSMISVNKFPVTEALQNTATFRHHSSQLPPPPLPVSQGVIAQYMTDPSRDHNFAPKDASLPLQSNSGERFPSYMLPNQQSHFSVTPIASWTSLPPPPPGVSLQLQQSHLASRDEFGSQIISRPYTTELPSHSQVSDFQHRGYPAMQEPHRSLTHSEDFRLKPLPLYNPPSQQFVGPGLLREDHLTQHPMMAVSGSSTFAQGDNQPVPTPFSLELPANRMQPFHGDKLPSGELLKSSSKIHPYVQQQQLPYGLHHLAVVGPSSKYPPDLQETNQSSRLPDLRGSRDLTYYNPYTSTLVQPPSSKFGSDVSSQEQETSRCSKYAAPFDLSHAQVDGQNIGSAGSGQATSSPNSARAVGQNFPRSGGDQYDPLLDSIDPSSNLSKKCDNAHKWEPSSDSDIMLRHSGSNKPLDVEENNKQKEVGGVAVATSVDDEEYGETADAEVGAVENESPNNPMRTANNPAGEIEIDQMKSPGKSRRNKEYRSMKLFKAVLADFVKEVLKPSWRQGNMSKEAFKTIVKKTVDKVSGAMKSHQIPKSRAKIDQYIDSSQRKLTKLVTGYVDKYVKM